MKEEKTVDRREFTLAAALAALSGVVITISASACGGGSSPSSPSTPTPSPGGGGAATDKTGVIGSNHGHSNSTITAAQLTAGGAVTLNIQGGASHPHTVELTQAEIASIAANQRVSKESSTDNGHSHTVTFN